MKTRGFASLFMAFFLTGCMTHGDAQKTVGLSSVALGTSTILANSGLNVPTPLARAVGVTSGVSQVASGLALMNDGNRTTGNGSTGPGRSTARESDLPRTRECSEYLRLATRPASMQMAGGNAQLARIFRSYERCLNSQPDHPTSRRLRCGKGKYYVYPRGIQACGTKEAMRIWGSGMP